MLFARCISQGIRFYAPGCFQQSVYLPEELGVIEAETIEPQRNKSPHHEPYVISSKKDTPKKEELPFRTMQQGLIWCTKVLDCDMNAAKDILKSIHTDNHGAKARKFYEKVMIMGYPLSKVQVDLIEEDEEVVLLPFKTMQEALEWCTRVLKCDMDTAEALLDTVEADENDSKARNFYQEVMGYYRSTLQEEIDIDIDPQENYPKVDPKDNLYKD